MPELKGWLKSSTDPSVVSNTVRGLILGASSFIILGASLLFKIELSAGDITTLATEIGMVVGAMWTVYGGIMKLVMWFGSKK